MQVRESGKKETIIGISCFITDGNQDKTPSFLVLSDQTLTREIGTIISRHELKNSDAINFTAIVEIHVGDDISNVNDDGIIIVDVVSNAIHYLMWATDLFGERFIVTIQNNNLSAAPAPGCIRSARHLILDNYRPLGGCELKPIN